MAPNARNFVRPNMDEPLKQYLVYDVSARLTDTYECTADARHGDPCLRTQYAYDTPTSGRISYRVETMATWDSSWEAF